MHSPGYFTVASVRVPVLLWAGDKTGRAGEGRLPRNPPAKDLRRFDAAAAWPAQGSRITGAGTDRVPARIRDACRRIAEVVVRDQLAAALRGALPQHGIAQYPRRAFGP